MIIYLAEGLPSRTLPFMGEGEKEKGHSPV